MYMKCHESVSGHDSALRGHIGLRTTWAMEMDFVMNHAPGAGSIVRHVDLQSRAQQLCYDCPFESDINYATILWAGTLVKRKYMFYCIVALYN